MKTKQNVVLVGFMGTGKSSVGRALAERLAYEFVDMDERIEAVEGRAISAIFATEGEAHFRQLERALACELAEGTGQVIATGGGIVLNPENIRAFEATGLVVCLQADPDTILSRVEHETHRPLLAEGDKMAKIMGLLEKRQALYDAVRHQIDTTPLSVTEIVDRIDEMLGGNSVTA